MAEALKDFLAALLPEAEASRLVNSVQARHEQRLAAAAEPPDAALVDRIAKIEEECAELGKRVRGNRESVPRLVVQRLEDEQSRKLSTLLAPNVTVEDEQPIDQSLRMALKAEVERSSELCTRTDSNATAVRSTIASMEQQQQLLHSIRQTEQGSVDMAIAADNKENGVPEDDTFVLLRRHVCKAKRADTESRQGSTDGFTPQPCMMGTDACWGRKGWPALRGVIPSSVGSNEPVSA